MKISFITTVFNEEKNIDKFLESLISQSKLPDEVIIIDGGSTDKTVSKIKNLRSKIKNYKGKFLVLTKKGNRAIGRNEAIKRANGDIIACSDSGNILDKKWIENIVNPFKDKNVDVVAGYYKSSPKNMFQKCLVPYVLVMPDKVDPDNFLPATRSVAFTKLIWKKVGGFPEKFSHNEDYVFANRLKKKGAKIVFSQDAIVYWLPRNTFKEAFIMFFRFALGDIESGIWRTNVLLLLARYFIGLYLIFLSILYKSLIPLVILLIFSVTYIIWSINKNYKYINSKEAIKILPLLQFTADASVLSGTISGILKKIWQFNYLSYIKQNKFLFSIIAIYTGVLLSTLNWGIPNTNHPFPYHMDEWHQLVAVANTFRYGTPNMAGSANGTMFHFILSGFYLLPFTLLRIINPFELTIDNLFMRERVFEVLRFQTILFGVLSIFVLYKIANLVNVSKKLTITLFTFTPIWLMLSGYFKYDIALTFWLLLSLLFILRFAKDPTNRNFIAASIPIALTFSTKVSSIPLFVLYIFSYFWFYLLEKKILKSGLSAFKTLFTGIATFIILVVLLGMPDTLMEKGNIYAYLIDNIIQSPQATQNFKLGTHPLFYLFTSQFSTIFGQGLFMLIIFSFFFLMITFFKEGLKKNKIEIFLLFSFLIFILSIIPLQIYAGGNRSLVILPLGVLTISSAFKKLKETTGGKKIISLLVIIISVGQIYQSYAWVYVKLQKSPQELASTWMENNIPKDTVIGIENIPIYQSIPDIIQKEFYFQQYGIIQNYKYKYQVIDSDSQKLPSVIVVTNDLSEIKFFKHSPKKDLLLKLEKEGYKKKATFSPNLSLYKYVGKDLDFYSSNIITLPLTISFYIK